MAKYSDAVEKAFQPGGDPYKASSDNLYNQYQQIAKQSGFTAANKFLDTESNDMKGILPDLSLEWAVSKFDSQSGVTKSALADIVANNDLSNKYDQVMAGQLLALANDRISGNGLDPSQTYGWDGINSGAWHEKLGDDGSMLQQTGPDANPDLVKAIDLQPSQEQIATYANLGAADAQQTAADRETNVTNTELAATAAIPTDRPLTSTEVSQAIDNQNAQQQNLAALQANNAVAPSAITADQQNIATADNTIANQGFTTPDNLLVKPGPNAIADGKVTQTDPAIGDTTSSTTDQNGVCSTKDELQYKAKAGDTLWGIAAKMIGVPNDKAHARDILNFTKLLEAGNPDLNPRQIKIGQTIKYVSQNPPIGSEGTSMDALMAGESTAA